MKIKLILKIIPLTELVKFTITQLHDIMDVYRVIE